MSQVYFTKDIKDLPELLKAGGLLGLISSGDSVAFKIHFGEPGNTAFLQPEMVKPIALAISQAGGKPFYTDCNTLYSGRRKFTKDHIKVAREHGFTRERAGADSVISEDEDPVKVQVGLKHFKTVELGGAAMRAPVLIALTHFKGHETTGFGGALKNLGMGMGTRRGKLRMHQDCAHCDQVKTCKKNQTLESCWVGSPELVEEKMVEYAYGAVKGRKAGYINFITRVSPNCDCYPFNDEPVVPDIGILASLDPVAIDQASVDLVNQAEGRIKSNDKFRSLYPTVDWEVQLKYGEAIGLGSRKYELLKIGG